MPDHKINFFDNDQDEASRISIRSLEEAGYDVQTVPTSGASAMWVDHYEVVGPTAIRNLAKQLLEKQHSEKGETTMADPPTNQYGCDVIPPSDQERHRELAEMSIRYLTAIRGTWNGDGIKRSHEIVESYMDKYGKEFIKEVPSSMPPSPTCTKG